MILDPRLSLRSSKSEVDPLAITAFGSGPGNPHKRFALQLRNAFPIFKVK
jgi:hypothetical protein